VFSIRRAHSCCASAPLRLGDLGSYYELQEFHAIFVCWQAFDAGEKAQNPPLLCSNLKLAISPYR
jgi:hypothetical protein